MKYQCDIVTVSTRIKFERCSLRRACPRNISRARMKCQRQCQKHWVYTLYDSLPVRQSSSCINFAPNLRLMMRDAIPCILYTFQPIAISDGNNRYRVCPALLPCKSRKPIISQHTKDSRTFKIFEEPHDLAI